MAQPSTRHDVFLSNALIKHEHVALCYEANSVGAPVVHVLFSRLLLESHPMFGNSCCSFAATALL
jgi:hypothetical protein